MLDPTLSPTHPSVEGKKYFTARPNYGIFVSPRQGADSFIPASSLTLSARPDSNRSDQKR